MITYAPPRFTPLPCNHCAALTSWPRWARIEPGRYECLCWPCFDRIDETFTAEQAVCQASAIVRRSAVTL